MELKVHVDWIEWTNTHTTHTQKKQPLIVLYQGVPNTPGTFISTQILHIQCKKCRDKKIALGFKSSPTISNWHIPRLLKCIF